MLGRFESVIPLHVDQLRKLQRAWTTDAARAGRRGDESHDRRVAPRPGLRQALGTRCVMPRRQSGQARMDRAFAEGECVDSLDRDTALGVL